MRTDNELFTLLRDFYIKNQPYVGTDIAICCNIAQMDCDELISKEEYDRLSEVFYDNRPSKVLHPQHFITNRHAFWWPIYGQHEETTQPRIDFLNYLVNNLTETI